MWSKEILGYIAPVTKTNEMYVAMVKVQGWLDTGYSETIIFRKWNGGDGTAKAGVNAYGVAYNTVAYSDKAWRYYKQID